MSHHHRNISGMQASIRHRGQNGYGKLMPSKRSFSRLEAMMNETRLTTMLAFWPLIQEPSWISVKCHISHWTPTLVKQVILYHITWYHDDRPFEVMYDITQCFQKFGKWHSRSNCTSLLVDDLILLPVALNNVLIHIRLAWVYYEDRAQDQFGRIPLYLVKASMTCAFILKWDILCL